MIESELCDTCQPYTRQKARTTSESTDDKQPIKSSGRPSRGCSFELCSCPLHKEVALGVATFPKSSLIPQDSSMETFPATMTLPKQAVTLCVCNVTMPNTQGRFCVLDARGKVIIAQPVRSVGTANQKSLSASSPTKTSGKGSGTASTQKPQRKRTSGKRHTPCVEIRPIPCIGCQGYSPSDNNDDDDFCNTKDKYLSPMYLDWMASHGCTKRTV